jgi:hypothetical protein
MSPRTTLAAAFAAAILPAAAHAGVAVSGAWSRPAAAGQNGAGYLTIVNTGPGPQTLRGASSPLAASVSLHQSVMTGGVMSMRTLSNGLAIAPGQSVTFRPGGYHLMLMRLKQPLKAGERAAVELDFAPAGKVKVELVVGAGPPDAHAGMAMR